LKNSTARRLSGVIGGSRSVAKAAAMSDSSNEQETMIEPRGAGQRPADVGRGQRALRGADQKVPIGLAPGAAQLGLDGEPDLSLRGVVGGERLAVQDCLREVGGGGDVGRLAGWRCARR
jgi:hypothetical protein